jgi:hypothetical protein
MLRNNKRAILAALASFIVGGSVVAECSNGGKISWDPKVVANSDLVVK